MVTTSRGRLLLVEDENVLRGLIAQFLKSEGFEVVEAADGLQGVSHFLRRGPFDVVLLDLILPKLPGVEVCREIKTERPAQSVIICSAAILDCHKTALGLLNVYHYLTKPYHPEDLLDGIQSHLTAPPFQHHPFGPASRHPLTRPTATERYSER